MKKILCVDNDLRFLHLYFDKLSEEGYEVILAKDDGEAVSKFDKLKPDIVVMDVRMPLIEATKVLNVMLGKNGQIPVIVNTTYPQYRENFVTCGAEACLIKTFDLSELKQKVRELLGKRQGAKAPRDYRRHLGLSE